MEEIKEQGWKSNKKKRRNEIGSEAGVAGIKLTTRISNLIKTKTTSLFVCGEEFSFTSVTDTVNFHNPAVKLVFHFNDIKVDVQEKAKHWKEMQRGNKHTKIKPTVYLEQASHPYKMATTV